MITIDRNTHSATRFRIIRGWGVFVGLAGLSALCSPNGVDALLLPCRLMRMSFAISSISEWRPVDFASPDPLEAWIALAILGGLVFGIRLPLSRALMLLLLLWMALTHVRNEELLGIIGPLLVAAPLAVQLRPRIPITEIASPTSERAVGAAAFTGIAVSAAALIALTVVTTARVLNRQNLAPRQDVAPVVAVEEARRAGLEGNVFNSVRFGGYLLFMQIPAFVDGRADVYGDAFLQRYVAASNAIGNRLPDLLDRYGIGWTLLEPSIPAVTLLDHLPGWERVYSDQYAIIHRRKPTR